MTIICQDLVFALWNVEHSSELFNIDKYYWTNIKKEKLQRKKNKVK